MNQLRYFSAFLLSTLVFSVLYFIFLAFSDVKKLAKPAASKVIKIAIITPPKKVAPPVIAPQPIVKKIEKIEPVVPMVIPKPKPKKVIKKKIIKKKIIKKKVVKKVKPKRVVKKKVVKKKIVKKKVIKKPKKVIKKKVVQEYIPEPIIEPYIPYVPPPAPAPPVYVAPKPKVQPVIKPTIVAPKVNTNNGQAKKAFLRNVRSKLIANKKYPKIANRRHIEGSVKVRFDITAHGHVTNIRFINGKRIFHKSIRKSLERTFPMGIPDDVRAELPIPDVSVTLHFNIR